MIKWISWDFDLSSTWMQIQDLDMEG